MQLTVTCDLTGTAAYPLEINESIEMENFVALLRYEFDELKTIPLNSLSISHNGRVIQMTAENLKKTINEIGIKDNDMIMINTNKPTTSNNQEQSQFELISNLVKSIKVPTAASHSHRNMNNLADEEARYLRLMFDSLVASTERREKIRNTLPQIVAAVDRQDYDAFCEAYLDHRAASFSRQLAMLDPTSVEGQRMIAEEIQRANINYSHQFAMEHMPEAYIPVTMLYIKMKINGYEVKAFVDSGAQISILSEKTAQRCNLMRLVDTRFRQLVHGVGGSQTMVGKIHACQVQIENQFFPCNFDVLGDRDIDVLLGLDILKRHRCIIDLQNNCLKFGDSAVATFLPDSEVPIRLVEVDSSKLAALMALGFEEAAARAMLIQCGNDVEAAAARLITEQSAHT